MRTTIRTFNPNRAGHRSDYANASAFTWTEDGFGYAIAAQVGRTQLLWKLKLESTPRALKGAQPLVERVSKIRILGSMALSIALTSAGAFDVFCAPLPVRVFDMAASLLLLQETGGVASTVKGEPLGGLRCDLETRSTLLCAPTAELHREALEIMGAGEP